jgi:cytochrome c biogenesis protein CcmG/thiol:disulfide interchange protein DsbE
MKTVAWALTDGLALRRTLLALLLCLAPLAWAGEPVPPKGLIRLDGRPAPALRLSDMDGKVTDLAHLRGHWVLVHFWASWCSPCRREMPTLAKLSRTLPPQRLTLLLVNTAETDDQVFSFLASVGMDLPSLMDRDGRVTERWQPRGLPSSFLVDPKGRLRYLALGGRDWTSSAFIVFLRALTAP